MKQLYTVYCDDFTSLLPAVPLGTTSYDGLWTFLSNQLNLNLEGIEIISDVAITEDVICSGGFLVGGSILIVLEPLNDPLKPTLH